MKKNHGHRRPHLVPQGLCGRTRKTCYRRQDAIKQAKYMRRHFETNIVEYKCDHCGDWHVGSQPGKLLGKNLKVKQ